MDAGCIVWSSRALEMMFVCKLACSYWLVAGVQRQQ